jgi:bla regulator protein BlaR1
MELFEGSSNWIMALGKTLVHSLWIGILCLSILKILFVLITPRFATIRYRTALAFLLAFTGTVVAMFLWLYTPLKGESEFMAAGTPGTFPAIHGLQDDNGWTKTVCYYSTFIYFTGIVFYLVYMIFSIGHIHAIRKGGKPVQGAWLDRFNAFKERAGIGIRTILLVSDRTDTPILAGFIRPVVIVPTGMLTQLPFSQVEAILMHELFHLKRFDHLMNLFQRMVEMLFFYNPAIWSLSRIIRIERENCCDDLVLRECSRPLDYARALYQLAQDQGRSPDLVPAATGNNKGELKNRIQRILNPTTMKTNIREKISALVLLAGGFLIVAVISGFSSGISITQLNQAPEEIILPDTIPAPDEDSSFDEAIDWEEIEKEIAAAKQKVMEEIDWEKIEQDIVAAKQKALEEIDWEQIKKDMEAAMKAIDWEEIEKNMEEVRIHMDSLVQNFDFDMDFDLDFDSEEEMIEN